MLEARKENKIYRISEEEKDGYLKDGYDIYKDNVVIEYTPKKLIKYADHLKVVKEKDARIKKLEEMKVAKDVTELLASYANLKNIDVGATKSAKGILDKILESEK